MSRSGYNDDYDLDPWQGIRWRGAVASAIRGRRGQAFLRELLVALDALPEHKLIANELEKDGAVCALGAVGKARGLALAGLHPDDIVPKTYTNMGQTTAIRGDYLSLKSSIYGRICASNPTVVWTTG
jgi:hypothetical protein